MSVLNQQTYPFQYRKVSESLVIELGELVQAGGSVVVLGPRYSGKEELIARLRDHLANCSIPQLQILLLEMREIGSEASLNEFILKNIPDSIEVGRTSDSIEVDPMRLLDEYYGKTCKPILLLVTNVDSLPHHIARYLLEKVRPRIANGSIIAVLGGEVIFNELVHGPKSEFNCANQFVIQGYDKQEFTKNLKEYETALSIAFEEPDVTYQRLYQLTGGNIHILRIVLRSLIDVRIKKKMHKAAFIKASDIPDCLKSIELLGLYREDVFRHSSRIMDHYPTSWQDLGKLIDNQPVHVASGTSAPTPLELAGIAVRTGSVLEFSSPLMADYVKIVYSIQGLGDLHARNADWEKAFRYYAKLQPTDRIRPTSVDDRTDVEHIITLLGNSLYTAATTNIDSVRKLFHQGCRYILGFNEITFWELKNDWAEIPTSEIQHDQAILHRLKKLASQITASSYGWYPLHPPDGKFAVAAVLPPSRSAKIGLVLVSDFTDGIVISRDREQMIKALIDHFIKAYTHAIKVQKDWESLARRRKDEIINSIFFALGSLVTEPMQALQIAASRIQKMGYRRVFFCLVDPKREWIRGILDGCNEQLIDLRELTQYKLAEPTIDLQAYIVRTKQPKIIEDASREPLADKTIVIAAKMKGLAIVPMLNPSGEAVGTIHIEREDYEVPSQEEVDDLMDFASKLAIAIEQSQRVELLQSALDRIPDPLVISNPLGGLKYANKPAVDLFGLSVGWREKEDNSLSSYRMGEEVWNTVSESLANGYRITKRITGIRGNSSYDGNLLVDLVKDWRSDNLGALLYLTNLSFPFYVIDALRTIAGSKDQKSAIGVIFKLLQKFGHKWGKLWIVDETNPTTLKGVDCFKESENDTYIEPFLRGDVHLYSSIDAESGWSPGQKEPKVFCCFPGRASKETVRTHYGLEATNVKQRDLPKEITKEPGDFWIYFPLRMYDKVVGLITLHCDERNYYPEKFEWLKVLNEMTSWMLGNIQERQLESELREKLILREAAEKAVADAAHNISTRIASLAGYLHLYQTRGDKYPEIKEINKHFAHSTDEVFNVIQGMKERLGPVTIHPSSFLLKELLETAYSHSMPEASIVIEELAGLPIQVSWDEHLIENAFLELIKNSVDFAQEGRRLIVQVSLETFMRETLEYVRITYKDNGPGIPLRFKERVFEDFFSRRPGRSTSTGVGLSYVYRIVNAHSGTIREVGKEGNGVEFIVEIPRQ